MFFNLHTHRYTATPQYFELVNQYPWEFDKNIPYYSIGIHPWYIEISRLEADLQCIEENLGQSGCLALGECGLDKRIDTDINLQIEVFKKQILLAEKHQKPIVLHCVSAYQEVIQIKNELNVSVPMIIHGFSKNAQTAQQLIKNGFYLSFGKYLLRNPELKSVFEQVPSDRFFLETDTVEETIEQVYAIAMQYKKQTIEEIQNQINNTCKTVFKNIPF
jgi:TatD DNase family protein